MQFFHFNFQIGMARFFHNHVGFRSFSSHIYIKIHRKILRNKQIMRLMILVMLFSLIYLVTSKSNVKTLTESMGQEVIEIGTPIKELPMGLEEEPSAEDDDDDKASVKSTGSPPGAATKKEAKKTTPLANVKTDKGVDKNDGLNVDEDEARIEKELAEIYKDTADYKTDSTEEKEVAKEPPAKVEPVTEEETSAEESDKPIGRQRNNFRFQPDATDVASVERFRTSVDEISCNNRQKLSGTVTPSPPPKKDAFRAVSNGIILITAVLSYVFICT